MTKIDLTGFIVEADRETVYEHLLPQVGDFITSRFPPDEHAASADETTNFFLDALEPYFELATDLEDDIDFIYTEELEAILRGDNVTQITVSFGDEARNFDVHQFTEWLLARRDRFANA